MIRLCLALSLLLSFLAVPPASAQDLARVRKNGKLVMVTFPHQQNPFIRVNLAKGPMVQAGPADYFEGFDVELMGLFARHLGVELEIRPVREPRYASLIPELLEGRGDLIASSLTITPERQRLVAFSRPYFKVYPVIVTHRDNDDIRSPADLRFRVGAVTAGSSHEERLLKMGVAKELLRRFDFAVEAQGAVAEGGAEYTMADSSVFAALREQGDLRIAFRLPEEHFFGIAVPLGSDLLPELDKFLLTVEKDGRLEGLRKRHFGTLLD